MRNTKNLILLLIVLLFSACTSEPQSKDIKSKNDLSVIQKNTNEFAGSGEDLASLSIMLPDNWRVDKSNKKIYTYFDEKGEELGFISVGPYKEDFDLAAQQPNHSSITNDEYIDIPLGKCRLITLDADNGSATSGLTGTHDVYYASIPIKGKAIYMLSFTKNDKKAETKKQFIELLKSLSLK